MPLLPLDEPADYLGSEVRFPMRDAGDGTPTRLWVTVTFGALEGLAPADLSGPQAVVWVESHRAAFEQIASAKHDSGQTLRITTNDWIERFSLPN